MVFTAHNVVFVTVFSLVSFFFLWLQGIILLVRLKSQKSLISGCKHTHIHLLEAQRERPQLWIHYATASCTKEYKCTFKLSVCVCRCVNLGQRALKFISLAGMTSTL